MSLSLEEKLDRMFANLDDADVIVTALGFISACDPAVERWKSSL
jgi:hypothetical protein